MKPLPCIVCKKQLLAVDDGEYGWTHREDGYVQTFNEGAEWQREQDFAETPEKIETMARALYEKQYAVGISRGYAPHWDDPEIPHARDDYRDQARAALTALREQATQDVRP